MSDGHRRRGLPIVVALAVAAGAALAFASMDWTGAKVKQYGGQVPDGWRQPCFPAAAEALALVSEAQRRGGAGL